MPPTIKYVSPDEEEVKRASDVKQEGNMFIVKGMCTSIIELVVADVARRSSYCASGQRRTLAAEPPRRRAPDRRDPCGAADCRGWLWSGLWLAWYERSPLEGRPDLGHADYRSPTGFWRAYPVLQKAGVTMEQMSSTNWYAGGDSATVLLFCNTSPFSISHVEIDRFLNDPLLAWG